MKKIYNILFILMTLIMAACEKDKENAVEDVEKIEVVNAERDTIYAIRNIALQLDVRTYPANQPFKCISSNSNVFKVDDSGLLSAKEAGWADLIVLAANGEDWTKKVYAVNVATMVEEIALKESSAIIKESADLASCFMVLPDGAVNKGLKYTSSDPTIASVTDTGVITCHKKGIVEITATATGATGDIVSDPLTVYAQYEKKELPKNGWTATAINSATGDGLIPENIFDGKKDTFWHCVYSPGTPPPYWILVDMQTEIEFDAIVVHRREGYADTRTVEFYTSLKSEDGISDMDESFESIGSISFGNEDKSITFKTFMGFPKKYKTRYLKLYMPDTNRAGNNSLAEITLSVID